ncbi:MAG: TIGR03621 family F420-dependent LLM class oxidoreductase [Iamia sp.]
MEARPFRFGYQMPAGTDPDDLRRRARRAEDAGFDVVHTADHVDPDRWPPLVALLVAAEATSRIRLCPLVLNNDFHHPVHLGAEVAALDRLSGGRVELGIGAGHSFTEYEQLGQRFDPPGVRKERMSEAVGILRRLLDGEEVTVAGEHYALDGARTMAPVQDRVPILVGVNGRDALTRAVRQADTVGLTGSGRTLEDGQHHEVRWAADRLDRTAAHIWAQAAGRERPLEVQALVQRVEVTDDRSSALEAIASHVPGLTVDDARTAPFLAVGTVPEIADHLRRVRERWGISYLSVRSIDAFAPVIAELRSDP